MKNKISWKIITPLFIAAFLLLPALVLAQDSPATPVPPAANPDPAATAPAKAEPKPNAAEKINVPLQIPLPFVPMKCKATDLKGNPIKICPPGSPVVSGSPECAETDKITVPAVCSLKDYIEGFYRLLVGAGALFAVVMIIIAGYQWMINGGSSGQIGDAKKRIWNASIGLVLALLSYIILNTISARLVDLRLPTVDPVQPFFTGSETFCATDPAVVKLAKDSPDQTHFFTEVGANASAGVGMEATLCGHKYSLPNNGGQCMGNICLRKSQSDPNNTELDPNRNCVQGQCDATMLYGEITWNRDGTVKGNGYVDNIDVYAVCGRRLMDKLVHIDVNGHLAYKAVSPMSYEPTYSTANGGSLIQNPGGVPLYKLLRDQCINGHGALAGDEFKGFVMDVEVHNDCFTLIYPDENYAMGKDKTKPLHQGSIYDPSDFNWGNVQASDLIPMADIENGALRYDLNIDRRNFPVFAHSGDSTTCPIQQ